MGVTNITLLCRLPSAPTIRQLTPLDWRIINARDDIRAVRIRSKIKRLYSISQTFGQAMSNNGLELEIQIFVNFFSMVITSQTIKILLTISMTFRELHT